MLNIKDHGSAILWVSSVQQRIGQLEESQRQKVVLQQTMDAAGRVRVLAFEAPVKEILRENAPLMEKYLLAMINNMMVSFGGAGMDIFYDRSDEVLGDMLSGAIKKFNADSPHDRRTGYGVYVNYSNRMNRVSGLPRFSMALRSIEEWSQPEESRIWQMYQPGDVEKERELLRKSALELEGRMFCSLDVGGNSIKSAVVKDGRILLLKEYKWFPAACRWAEEMNAPQMLLLRFMALAAQKAVQGQFPPAAVMDAGASFGEVTAACEKMEAEGLSAGGVFDGVVIGFPDIVVNNKVAGGESFKHSGMKSNPQADYEEEFAKSCNLDDMAAAYVKPGRRVIVLNDGNAASFITSVEQAFVELPQDDRAHNGTFVNTIGTEMGTGFVSNAGTIQQIPLEGFQHIIDLGNTDLAVYPADDVRSINNTNTGVAGTVQKYVSQMGMFRMAVNSLLARRPQVIDQLMEEGILVKDAGGKLSVASDPVDRRGQFTRWIIGALDEGDPLMEEVFVTMGAALGELMQLDRSIFPEIGPRRLLSGGIVASDKVYHLIVKGLKGYDPSFDALRLDETNMHSPLLQGMKPEERNFNTAIGSAYIANRYYESC